MADTQVSRNLLSEKSRAGDLLQHRPLAKALADAIRDTPDDESLGIALYGPWGQGKSMIGNLLEECFADGPKGRRHVFVRIDAWKYAHEVDRQPLRRHYLLRAYEAAGLHDEAKQLRRAFSQKFISEAIDERSTTTTVLRSLIQRSKENWALGLVFLALIGVLWYGFPDEVSTFVVTAVGIAAAVLIAGSIVFETAARALATGLTVTTEDDPFRSVEEFDHQFSTLLTEDAKDVERFVFFIDDLDRCNDRTVVEAIETLQAFFGRAGCAYVVSADERQLKRAVRAASTGPARLANETSVIPIDETFLEKIFQTSVYVPWLFPENLREYAQQITRDTALASLGTDSEQEDLLGYLVHAHVVSPRQVRVVINDFLMTMFEAQEREKDPATFLTGARLTSDPLLLAKVVVLRAHFPWFFELLRSKPELLVVWPQIMDVSRENLTDDERVADDSVWQAARRAVDESRAFARPVAGEVDEDEPSAPEPEAAGTENDVDEYEQLARDMVEALRGYLTLTREAVPEDSTHVEELLMLRSREELAGLTGDAGRRLRRLVATGDTTPIADVISDNPDLAVEGVRAAVDRVRLGTRLERIAARRVLLELVKQIDDDVLEPHGAKVEAALYGSSQSELPDDDVDARAKLVPWMDSHVLGAQVANAWPSNLSGLDLVLSRAHDLRAHDVVVSELERHVEEVSLVGAVSDALENGPAEIAEAYASATAKLAGLYGNPVNARFAVPFTVEAVSGSSIEGRDEETEQALEIVLADKLVWSAEEHMNQRVVVDLYEFRRRWRVYRVATEADPSVTTELPRPTVVGSDTRRALTRLLTAAFGRARQVDGAAWQEFARVHYDSDSEAAALLAILDDAASDGRLIGSEVALKAILAGRDYAAGADLSARVVRIAAKLGPAAIEDHREALLKFAWRSAPRWSTEDEASVSGALRSLQDVLAPAADYLETQRALDEMEPEAELRAIRRVVAPIAPPVAVAATTRVLAGLAEKALEGEPEAELAVNAGLDLLVDLSAEAPVEVAATLPEIWLDSDAASVASGFIRVADASGFSEPLGANVLRAGSAYSSEAAHAALSCVIRWGGPDRPRIRAVLEGVAQVSSGLDIARVAAAIRETNRIEPEMDQLGRLAGYGGVELAESVAAALHVRHLQRRIHEAARRVADPLAEQRLRFAEAWSGESSQLDRLAADEYVEHLQSANTQARLALVLGSLLRYFPTPGRVRRKGQLRSAILAAARRVSPITNEGLQEALEQAREQLGLETASNRDRLERLFGRIFRSSNDA